MLVILDPNLTCSWPGMPRSSVLFRVVAMRNLARVEATEAHDMRGQAVIEIVVDIWELPGVGLVHKFTHGHEVA